MFKAAYEEKPDHIAFIFVLVFLIMIGPSNPHQASFRGGKWISDFVDTICM